MFKFYNPNPVGARVGDCAVRAVAKAVGQTWEETYIGLVLQGFLMADLPSSNAVWGEYLRKHGFVRHIVPNTCPECYTVSDFCDEHPQGVFVLALSGHVVTAVDGDIYDTWDSTQEIPIYFFERMMKNGV